MEKTLGTPKSVFNTSILKCNFQKIKSMTHEQMKYTCHQFHSTYKLMRETDILTVSEGIL